MSVIKKRFVAGLQAAGFVLLTLAAWWVFAALAATVVSCVPWDGRFTCESPFSDRPRLNTAVRISMLIVSLLAAIWVGNRWFYTADTYEPRSDVPPAPQIEPGVEHESPRPRAVNE